MVVPQRADAWGVLVQEVRERGALVRGEVVADGRSRRQLRGRGWRAALVRRPHLTAVLGLALPSGFLPRRLLAHRQPPSSPSPPGIVPSPARDYAAAARPGEAMVTSVASSSRPSRRPAPAAVWVSRPSWTPVRTRRASRSAPR